VAGCYALTLALTLTACDRSTTTDPKVEQPAASAVGTQAARAIALAMADTQVRIEVLIDLRNSPYSEHKVILQDYLRTSGGRKVLAAIERAGIDSDSLDLTLRDAPPIQFYVPINSQRSSWRGSPDILVASLLGQEAPDVGFTPDGSTRPLSSRERLTQDFGAVFALQWAEPMFRRWGGPTAAAETIQLEGESQMGSGTIERDATGRIVRTVDATPEGGLGLYLSPPGESVPAGTYVDYVGNNGVCDNWPICDDLELQFVSSSANGGYIADLLTGIGAPTSTWRGWWKIHTLRATSTVPIDVALAETDQTSGDDEFFCAPYETSNCSPERHPRLTGLIDELYYMCEVDCSGGAGELDVGFTDHADPVVTTVTVSPPSSTIYTNGSTPFSATPTDQYGDTMAGKVATWLSTNTSVATVASTGDLTATANGIAAGQATIRATIDGVDGNATLTVNQTPPSVSISGPQTLTLHQSAQYFANVYGGTQPYTYEWRDRDCGPQFGCSAWANWFSTGSQNYTFASINGCGLNEIDLESRVTDALSRIGYSSTYIIHISNPC